MGGYALVEPNDFPRAGRGDFKREPGDLSVLVTARMPGGKGDSEFVRHRFHRPLAYSVKWSIRYEWAFTILSIAVIAGGLLSSALAAAPGGGNDTLIVAVGLTIAVVAAVNRLWRPGLRAVARHRTANSLRHEGWMFVCGRERYDGMSADESRAAFIDEVERINKAVESIDESTSETEEEG